jgi:Endonuclease/Exonuclease/phosphatase family
MPYYPGLNYNQNLTDEKTFIRDRLLLLKDELAKAIPRKTVDDTLLLATWNIREFDSEKYGPRMESSFYYIAEIISHFDFVAIQEIRDDLTAFKKLMKILGLDWDYVVSDITEGRAGNGERMAFVYDKRKVRFTNMAGELVLPEKKGSATLQFARTPYIVSFQSGWFKFNITTVHAYYGKGKPGMKRRVNEIREAALFLKKRADRETDMVIKKKALFNKWDNYSYVLLGDFNIINREDETYEALTKGTSFFIHDGVLKHNLEGTNVKRDMFYDQIAFLKKDDLLEMGSKAGVFDFYNYVFTEADFKHYKPMIKAKPVKTEKFYKEWKTYQMSDHLPLWVEMKIDFSRKYLEAVK